MGGAAGRARGWTEGGGEEEAGQDRAGRARGGTHRAGLWIMMMNDGRAAARCKQGVPVT